MYLVFFFHFEIADEKFGACRIAGSFEANKLSGNMHITAVGHGYHGEHIDHKRRAHFAFILCC